MMDYLAGLRNMLQMWVEFENINYAADRDLTFILSLHLRI